MVQEYLSSMSGGQRDAPVAQLESMTRPKLEEKAPMAEQFQLDSMNHNSENNYADGEYNLKTEEREATTASTNLAPTSRVAPVHPDPTQPRSP